LLANVRNPDVAGVHNENDLNMFTRVAERTVSRQVSCLGYLGPAHVTFRPPQSWMISTWLAKTPPLTPLIWDHVNPYGRFELDMNTRFAAQIIQMASGNTTVGSTPSISSLATPRY
jgi:hypothetical protein